MNNINHSADYHRGFNPHRQEDRTANDRTVPNPVYAHRLLQNNTVIVKQPQENVPARGLLNQQRVVYPQPRAEADFQQIPGTNFAIRKPK